MDPRTLTPEYLQRELYARLEADVKAREAREAAAAKAAARTCNLCDEPLDAGDLTLGTCSNCHAPVERED